jgi:TPR repeat protein
VPDAAAQENLGHMFLNGTGVAEDREEAIRWFRLAPAQENLHAAATLVTLGV